MKKNLLLLFTLFFAVMNMWAKDYYVSPSGSNSNNGSSGAPWQTINYAISQASAGDIIYIAAGTYNENVIVDKRLTLDGDGPDVTIISSTGTVMQVIAGNNDTERTVIKDIKLTGGATGIIAGSYTTLQNIISRGNSLYGINLNPLTDLVITDCSFSFNGSGLKLASTASASHITITGSHFDNNTQNGWYSDANSTAEPDLDNLSITNTTFSDNLQKGFYTERLSNATFDDVTINNTGSTSYDWGAGIDINLKWKDYSTITIINSNITNCGIGSLNGVGITVKARDDGGTYGPNPATLTNVIIDNVIFSGNKNGLNFGEPAPNNAGPTGVVVKNCDFSNVVMDINNFSQSNLDATISNSFTGATDNFAIENRIYHKLDNAVKGLVTWVASNVYVTTASGSIQRGIDAATATWTVNVGPGTYTTLNTTINKSLTLLGDPGDGAPGAGTNAPIIDGLGTPGDAFKIVHGVSNVTIKGFEMKNITSNANGIGNGISAWVGSTNYINIEDNYFHNLGYNGVLVGNDKNINTTKWGDHSNWIIKNNILETFEAYGFELTNASNSSIENNIIHVSSTSAPNTAIMVDARRNTSAVTIKNNVIDGSFQLTPYSPPSTYWEIAAIYVFANDFEVPGVTLNNVIIENNQFSVLHADGKYDIRVYEYTATSYVTGVQVRNNNMTSLGNGTVASIDATNNYWGNANGPVNSKNIFNIGLQSGTVIIGGTGGVNFVPWWSTISGAPGTFTGTSFAPITNNNAPAENYSNFTDAIAGTTAGGVINAAAGTFTEKLNITKSLALNGAKAGEDARTRNTATGESILDGTGLGAPYDGIKIANGVSNVIIDGFEIRNYAGSGSNGDGNAISSYCMSSSTLGASNVTVRNNYIHDLAYNGILVGSQNIIGESMVVQTGWTIQNNKVTNFKYAGIELTNVTTSQVSDNAIIAPTSLFDDPGDAGVGIEVAARSRAKGVLAGTGITVSGNSITGTFPAGSRAAINLLSRAYTPTSNAALSGITVSGNTISGATNTRAAVLAVSESRNGPATISGLTISGNNVLDGNFEGIVIQDYLNGGASATHSNVSITGNEIKNNTNNGIHILSGTAATGIAANSNKILNNTLFGAKNEGTGTLNATCNYWGTMDPSEIAAKISGDVAADPFNNSTVDNCTNHFPFSNETTGEGYLNMGDAIANAEDGDHIDINNPGNSGGITVSKPGKHIHISNPGHVPFTFTGASPALTVTTGTTVTINGGGTTTYTNATDAPTILVETGATLNITGCTIEESTGPYDQSGILVQGTGVLNAGTVATPGHNKFITDGFGMAINNENISYADAKYNYWGSTEYVDIASQITGNVLFDPWCNSTFTDCGYNANVPGPITYAGKVVKSPIGSGIVVPITVDNFTNVDAISLKIKYNPAILTFVNGTDLHGPFSWGIYEPYADEVNGYIYISAISGSGVTFTSPGTLLLNLNFTSILTGTSLLEWTDNGISCEYQNSITQMPFVDGPNTADFYKNGFVTDMYVTFNRDYALNQIIAEPHLGSLSYTYAWTGFGSTPQISTDPYIVPANGYGTYTVVVTDNVGAQLTATYYYGPVHNINTKFDFAHIQSAIDTVNTLDGHSITIDPGTYTEQVTIPKSLTITGAGETTTTILAPDVRTGYVTQESLKYDYVVGVYPPSSTIDVRLEGFTIDANSKTETPGTDRLAGLIMCNVKDAGGTSAGLFSSTIQNFATTNQNSVGLAIFGDGLLTVNGNDIHGYKRFGLRVRGDVSTGPDPNVTVTSNLLTGSADSYSGMLLMYLNAGSVTGNTTTGHSSFPTPAAGIAVFTSTGLTITGNQVTGNTNGIDLNEGAYGNIISGNTLTNNIKRGISLAGAYNNTISGNTITGPSGGTDDVGIGIAGGSTGNMIGGPTGPDGNIITMATSGAGMLYGVNVDPNNGAGSNTIKFNTFNGGKRHIQIDGGTTGTTTIDHNNLINTSATDAYGISMNGGSAVISFNTLTNTVRPMEFWGAINLDINNNSINGSIYDAINLGAVSGTKNISQNFLSNCPTVNAIIGKADADNLVINCNEITGCSRGINIQGGCTGVSITNNNIHDNSYSGIELHEVVSNLSGNMLTNSPAGDVRGIETFSSLTAHNNFFSGFNYGAVIFAAAGSFDVTYNWWNSENGPRAWLSGTNVNTFNQTGQTGEYIQANSYGNFVFAPWLTSGTDNSGDCGFQPAAGTSFAPVYANSTNDATETEQYASIQAANNGTSLPYVFAKYGWYSEHPVINKSITLKGLPSIYSDKPIIGGSDAATVVSIVANNVTLDGFQVRNSGLGADRAGILLQGVDHCVVKNNTVTLNFAGIALASSTLNTVQDNVLTANYFGIYVGTDTYPSTLNTISGNNVSGTIKIPTGGGNYTGDGIYGDKDCDGNIYIGNIVHENGKDGFYFWKSAGNTVTGNTVTNNVASGFELMGSANNIINGNNIVSGNHDGFTVRISGSYPTSPNTITGNKIYTNTNYGIYASPEVTSVNGIQNWWGDATGPHNDTINHCGLANGVTSNVAISPWYYQLGMTTLNGLPLITMSPIDDISTITKTPVIFSTFVTYPDNLENYDPAVLTDARITTGTVFPAGSKVISVKYNGVESLLTEYSLAEKTVVYLSEVLATAPAQLYLHDGLTLPTWEITVAGFDLPATYAITMDAVSYIGGAGSCNNVLGTESFSVTFADATFAVSPAAYTACFPAPLIFSAEIGYPLIANMDTDVKTDAYITSTGYTLPAGTQIKWGYDSPPATTYTLITPATTIYLSDIVAGGVPGPLQGNGGTDTWNFEISNYGTPAPSIAFNLDMQPVARLSGTDYSYTLGDYIDLTVLNCGIAGKVRYHNSSNTLMNNVEVQLWNEAGTAKLYPASGTIKTDGSGNYTMPLVPQGTYQVRLSTIKPVGGINSTDAAQVNNWFANHSIAIEKTRFYAGDVSYEYSISAYDAARIQGYFVQNVPFSRTSWTFWRAGETTNDVNAPAGVDYWTITVGTSNPNQSNINFYGLVTGDFNRSFIPGNAKAGTEDLELVYLQNYQVNASTEIEMPVYTVNPVNVGAVSMILNFPAELVEVTNVSMNLGGQLDWSVKGDELRIGWNTQNPVSLAGGAELLTLSLRTRTEFTQGKEIRFTLADSPLNELADDYYEVIPDAVLGINSIEASSLGISDPGSMPYALGLTNHPNPFKDYTMIAYSLPFEGRVILEVYSVLGNKVATLVDARQAEGNYMFEFQTNALQPGVYIATLKFQGNNQTLNRTIKIVRN